MKRLGIISAAVISVVMLATSAFAQDLNKAVDAYNAGDYDTALQEWRLLAEQGDALAQFILGDMYYNGQGVLQDNVLAHMWLNLGAVNGHELGAKNRDIIAKKMTPQAIEQAQEMASECMSSDYKNCGY